MVFDCDGVLVDSEPLHYRALQEVLQPSGLGFDLKTYMERYLGFDDRDIFRTVFADRGRPLDSKQLRAWIGRKSRAFRRLRVEGVPSFPGTSALVRALHNQGVPMAVASGALHDEVRLFLDALGLADAFLVVVGADDVEHSKPDPETYRRALEGLASVQGRPVSPRRCVAIEDTPAGIRSAGDAGLYVIAVAHTCPLSELTEADHTVQRMTELNPDYLGDLLQAAFESG